MCSSDLQGRFSEKGTQIVQLVTLPLFFRSFRLHNPKKVNCETTDGLLAHIVRYLNKQ